MKIFSPSLQACLLAALLLSGAVAGKLLADEVSVSLVNNGKGNASIVIAAAPTPSADLAAMELQYFVEKI
ncbi:MAG: hypothetical protein ACI9TH_003424, partial [Kiritimatiellia bacterium]